MRSQKNRKFKYPSSGEVLSSPSFLFYTFFDDSDIIAKLLGLKVASSYAFSIVSLGYIRSKSNSRFVVIVVLSPSVVIVSIDANTASLPRLDCP